MQSTRASARPDATSPTKSRAFNLVPGDHNKMADIFRWDATTGKTTLISHTLLGAQIDKFSYDPTVSSDGRYVAFVTNSTTMGPADTNRLYDATCTTRPPDRPSSSATTPQDKRSAVSNRS